MWPQVTMAQSPTEREDFEGRNSKSTFFAGLLHALQVAVKRDIWTAAMPPIMPNYFDTLMKNNGTVIVSWTLQNSVSVDSTEAHLSQLIITQYLRLVTLPLITTITLPKLFCHITIPATNVCRRGRPVRSRQRQRGTSRWWSRHRDKTSSQQYTGTWRCCCTASTWMTPAQRCWRRLMVNRSQQLNHRYTQCSVHVYNHRRTTTDTQCTV